MNNIFSYLYILICNSNIILFILNMWLIHKNIKINNNYLKLFNKHPIYRNLTNHTYQIHSKPLNLNIFYLKNFMDLICYNTRFKHLYNIKKYNFIKQIGLTISANKLNKDGSSSLQINSIVCLYNTFKQKNKIIKKFYNICKTFKLFLRNLNYNILCRYVNLYNIKIK